MLQVLDRLPLLALGSGRGADARTCVVPLPIVAVEHGGTDSGPSRPSRFYPWLLDSAYTGEAHVWRTDLMALGLDLNVRLRRRGRPTVSAFGEQVVNLSRAADLWLFSNVPGLPDRSFLLPLRGGLEVHVPASLTAPRGGLGLPLIGNRLLTRAGARLDIDYRRRTLSLWLPASPVASALQWPRRWLGRPEPVAWHR